MIEFLRSNQMYIVLVIVLIVWGGIVFYLVLLENKIKRLEKSMKRN